ncbi:MAG: PocR ligand-binding domain-containing protein [Caldilineaceae bacterium]|nr:PocR ligand-binding domain-containing protein [Caldilineaceae bacterium]
MDTSDTWPYLPTVLSQLIEPHTLSVLLSGCSTRLGRALTVLDYDYVKNQFQRIDPLVERQNFSPFCVLFRDPDRVQGGNDACVACDHRRTRQVIGDWRKNQQPAPRMYTCHMGLADYSALISVGNVPVAVLLTGQYAQDITIETVSNRVQHVVDGSDRNISFNDNHVPIELVEAAASLEPAPDDFRQKVEDEVLLLQQLAEDRYQKIKREKEQKFLDDLRSLRRFGEVTSLHEIRTDTGNLLDRICRFCGAEYIVLYTNFGPNDTILTPIASGGKVSLDDLPHFNWRKANLDESLENTAHRFLMSNESTFRMGLRGAHVALLSNAPFGIASCLGETYRAVMVFGPMRGAPNIEAEKALLSQLSRIVGWFVSSKLQSLRLYQESERRKATEILLQHRIRTALTPITTHLASATLKLDRLVREPSILDAIKDAVKGAYELTLRLGKVAGETPRTIQIMVESDDLKVESYPLSVLIANCAAGFEKQAREQNRLLVVDPSIENLPSANVDIARLTIAVSNVLENAVKYSFPGTTIYVRAVLANMSPNELAYDIEIENLGHQIPPEKMQEIYDRGERGLVNALMGKIYGTGYGLWEAKAVLKAHSGDITATCEETRRHHSRFGTGYKVTFTMRIPVMNKSE